MFRSSTRQLRFLRLACCSMYWLAISENDTGVYAPGSVIFNPPGHTHRITTADREPCLLAYAWVGDEASLLRQKMVFSRSSRTG